MQHRTWSRALALALACGVLLYCAPAMAGPGIGRWHRTIGSLSQVGRPGAVDAPQAGKSRGEARAAAIVVCFLSGMLLGVCGGIWLSRVVLPWWQHRQQCQREIDQLTTQFYALFRNKQHGDNPE